MSQNYIGRKAEDVFLQLFESLRFQKKGRYPRLDDRQKNQIRQDWATYMRGDPTETGIQLFIRLFELYPHVQDKFEYAHGTAVGEFRNNSRGMFDVNRVIRGMNMVVERLDRLEQVVPILKQIGGRHGTRGYNIPANYFPENLHTETAEALVRIPAEKIDESRSRHIP